MKINIRSNVDDVVRNIERKYRKQIPYATSKAINEVAKKARVEVDRQIKSLDNPTPFTLKASFVKYSNKNQSPIKAIVGVKDIQEEYLKYAEEGGVSRPNKGKAKPVPTSGSKNKYGNLPKTTTKQIGKGKVFSGTPKGGNRPPGIYKRMGQKGRKNLKMLASWHESTQHTQKMRVGDRVRIRVQREFEKELRKQVADAIRTAR